MAVWNLVSGVHNRPAKAIEQDFDSQYWRRLIVKDVPILEE